MEIELLPLLVRPDQALNVRCVQDPASPARVREQQVIHNGAELPAEPTPERHRKAVLGTVQNLIRQNPAERAFEKILRPTLAQLQLGRNGGGELDKFVIEQRNASLD